MSNNITLYCSRDLHFAPLQRGSRGRVQSVFHCDSGTRKSGAQCVGNVTPGRMNKKKKR